MLKYPKQFKITPPMEAEGSFKKFAEIAERENKSMTQLITEFVENYVKLHDPGNPQQRLDTIMELGRAYRANECCVCGIEAIFEAYDKKRYCKAHFWAQPLPGRKMDAATEYALKVEKK